MMQEVASQSCTRAQDRKLRVAAHAARVNRMTPRFSMAFQPIVNVATATTYAFEALVRSADGEGADTVLSRVPRRNLHMFDLACRSRAMVEAIRCNLLESPTAARLCVNVNPNAAVERASNLRLTCDEAMELGFPLDRLILELVEGDDIADFEGLMSVLDEYRGDGVLVAMDDFGAGYSGLKLLSRLKPDVVKLDMSLISQIAVDRTSAVIVRTMVQACYELEIMAVAEGVETYDIAMRLRDMGVMYQQGNYFARPAFEALPRVDCRLPEAMVR